MKKQILLTALALSTIIVSCKKSSDDSATPTVATVNANSTGDYQPNTAGSTWTYAGTGQTPSYTLSMLNGDTTCNGSTWKKGMNSQATAPGLLRKDGTNYIQAGSDDYSSIANFIYLKDNVVGTSWTNDVVYFGFNYRYTLKIVGIGLTKTVSGKTYGNVISVSSSAAIDTDGSGTYTTAGETTYSYYAKGVGLIMADFASKGQNNLVSYTIK